MSTPEPSGQHVLVDSKRLSADTLESLVEEFVSRSGTDYGAVERDLGDKKQQVLAQLRRGDVVIVFDVESESCNLMTRADYVAQCAMPPADDLW